MKHASNRNCLIMKRWSSSRNSIMTRVISVEQGIFFFFGCCCCNYPTLKEINTLRWISERERERLGWGGGKRIWQPMLEIFHVTESPLFGTSFLFPSILLRPFHRAFLLTSLPPPSPLALPFHPSYIKLIFFESLIISVNVFSVALCPPLVSPCCLKVSHFCSLASTVVHKIWLLHYFCHFWGKKDSFHFASPVH